MMVFSAPVAARWREVGGILRGLNHRFLMNSVDRVLQSFQRKCEAQLPAIRSQQFAVLVDHSIRRGVCAATKIDEIWTGPANRLLVSHLGQ